MIVSATGWFPQDILWKLTWQDVVDLTSYWAIHPPLQSMVESYLGYKPKAKAPQIQYRGEVKDDGPSAFSSFVEKLNQGS